MTKLMIYTLFIFGASLIGWSNTTTEASAVIDSEEPKEIVLDNEHLTLEEPAIDYYSDYLQVLGAQGPKQANASSQTNDRRTSFFDKSAGEQYDGISAVGDERTAAYSEIDVETENEVIIEADAESEIAKVDHKAFGQLLKKHVNSNGDVNYAGFKNDISKLDAYLDKLRNNPVTPTMSKNERLAYWINVYNAFTIKLILDNYPVNSIQDIAGGKPWDKVFIKLGNTSYSLNNIENDIIRQKFTEPRIHFAVNCEAKSCPPLLNDAYYPETLLDQLSERTKSFVSNNSYNTITKKTLKVSKIFDWYGKDFGDVKRYIDRNVDIDVTGLELQFNEYDWALNKQ